MPANLTPQYLAAEQAFKQARTIEEKIATLEEMLAVIPKHKGTEKLQADLKTRLAKLRDESEKRARAGRADPFLVPREGAGQVILAGFPNVGKSSLVGALTRARVIIADYPFSTALPISGMMPFEDVQIQLVDMPPLTADGGQPGQIGTMRNADAILVLVDASSDDCVDQLDGCLGIMRERRVLVVEEIEGVRSVPFWRCLVVATKVDLLDQDIYNLDILRELAPEGIEVFPVSARTGYNLDLLKKRIFKMLGVIRIYSKLPGKDPDLGTPFVLKRGSTVVDMARAVHRDFPERLKYARIWGSVRFGGQAVPRDYVLQDRDIVELHLS